MTGNATARLRAHQAMMLLLYSVRDDGCPKDRMLLSGCDGWVEDSHLDRVHNVVGVLEAFPEWEK